MARTAVTITTSLDDAWTSLQRLTTWEGVAGIEDLREPRHDPIGNLTSFRFAMDTAMGRVDGRAKVASARPGMTIRTEQKGVQITLHVVLKQVGEQNWADVDAHARATSFFTKPIEMTLNALLDNSIDDEAATIAARLAGPSGVGEDNSGGNR